MSLRVYVFCDVCSEGQTVGGKLRREEGRGWHDGNRGYGLGLGWEYRGGQDICPDCQYEAAAEVDE